MLRIANYGYKSFIFHSICLWYTNHTHSAGHVLSAHALKLVSISRKVVTDCCAYTE